MHDGRFTKLSEVLNHYTTGIKPGQTLVEELKKPILLDADEKADLIAFLLTLDDKAFVFDPKHQFPKEMFSAAKDF
jgi:cytochrome c peroxidase